MNNDQQVTKLKQQATVMNENGDDSCKKQMLKVGVYQQDERDHPVWTLAYLHFVLCQNATGM